MELGPSGRRNGIIVESSSGAVMKKEMPLNRKSHAVMAKVFTGAITHAHLWPGFKSFLGYSLH